MTGGCNMNNIDKEYALLASYMFTQTKDEMNRLPKLNIDIFSNGFTKSIAKIINELIEKHDYCDDLAVEAFIIKNENYNEIMWLDLIAKAPLTSTAVSFYTKWLTNDYAQRKLNEHR
jgi:uncharacterized membrane protein